MKFKTFASILSLCIFCIYWTGCSTPPATFAYQTESAANVGIIAAMTAWGSYVAAVHPGVAAETKVKSAFEKTQLAELALIDATSAWVASNPSAGGSATPANVAAAQAALSQATSELVALVQSFGVTLK